MVDRPNRRCSPATPSRSGGATLAEGRTAEVQASYAFVARVRRPCHEGSFCVGPLGLKISLTCLFF
jgi:hypothetical protein